MSKEKLLPEVAEHFTLEGYTPGPMGLKDGRVVDFTVATLPEVEKIFEQGTAEPYLVKRKRKTKPTSDSGE